ncbi:MULTISPECIES: hypothetical protein [unclassified Arthrobacter]|uniref:hypothetical protein n=1 Tax=unclassified Arthrobacter TaxID=235627 RepID=UPI001D156DDD|nr:MULTISPECIES: hypothetical protein [unclassified Arthrobacter]MCC3275391.1 hypothetical protein [Arthrobacter sp. zg-Y20]MCC9176837.1 hypothetical protein [Arthrobacter sp. zg-Y750]MDK1315550.1 hypothetical protein [Arthrobacter sp. zg.Y20]MDK1326455.1 hypothetical protein [Arthrobacter sp. zg-Y1143]WIB05965.1 hypothetical protein QNO06_15825 [Arthrobacter sp. zg-Y20]
METRSSGIFAALLLAGLLAGCGATDAEMNEARARAEASASPSQAKRTLRPCPGGEILRTEPSGMQSIRPECYDQAVAEAIAEFPEPLPAGVEWQVETTDFSDPEVRAKLGDISIADGNQDNDVAAYWLCAWMDAYISASDAGDAAAQEQSMGYLAKYTSLPASREYMVNPEVFDAAVVEPARAGNPAKLREYYKGSCSAFQRAAHPGS